MKNIQELYDAAASRYDDIYNSKENHKIIKAENKVLIDCLPPAAYAQNKTVLDCGAGTGLFLDLFREEIKPYNYLGLDISEKMLSQAKAKHKQYKFLHKDFMSYSDENKYDLVTSLFSITDYCGEEGFIKLFDYIKKGGFLYVTFLNSSVDYEVVSHEGGETIDPYRFTYKQIQDLLDNIDYDWSYTLGLSSIEYDNKSETLKDIYRSMNKNIHNLSKCKYYLLILQL